MQEVVIIDGVRTPIGRHAGALSDVRPDDLAALVIREIVSRTGVDPNEVEEVYFGCANQMCIRDSPWPSRRGRPAAGGPSRHLWHSAECRLRPAEYGL